VVSYTYDSFGNFKVAGSATLGNNKDLKDENPFRYSSYFYDKETRNYYLNSRYYSSSIGRFITRDVIASHNLYVYANNNPVIFLDPTGYYPVLDSTGYYPLSCYYQDCLKPKPGYQSFMEAYMNRDPLIDAGTGAVGASVKVGLESIKKTTVVKPEDPLNTGQAARQVETKVAKPYIKIAKSIGQLDKVFAGADTYVTMRYENHLTVKQKSIKIAIIWGSVPITYGAAAVGGFACSPIPGGSIACGIGAGSYAGYLYDTRVKNYLYEELDLN
jgi:RHS repeat-associated protein